VTVKCPCVADEGTHSRWRSLPIPAGHPRLFFFFLPLPPPFLPSLSPSRTCTVKPSARDRNCSARPATIDCGKEVIAGCALCENGVGRTSPESPPPFPPSSFPLFPSLSSSFPPSSFSLFRTAECGPLLMSGINFWCRRNWVNQGFAFKCSPRLVFFSFFIFFSFFFFFSLFPPLFPLLSFLFFSPNFEPTIQGIHQCHFDAGFTCKKITGPTAEGVYGAIGPTPISLGVYPFPPSLPFFPFFLPFFLPFFSCGSHRKALATR